MSRYLHSFWSEL